MSQMVSVRTSLWLVISCQSRDSRTNVSTHLECGVVESVEWRPWLDGAEGSKNLRAHWLKILELRCILNNSAKVPAINMNS